MDFKILFRNPFLLGHSLTFFRIQIFIRFSSISSDELEDQKFILDKQTHWTDNPWRSWILKVKFCIFAGSIGTAGRACNKTSKGIDGCDLLCCGRGYDTRRVLTTQPCNCTFRWCCAVECKTCTQWKDEHYCKPLQSFEVNKIRP